VPFRRLFPKKSPAARDLWIGPAPAELRPEGLASVLGAGSVATPAFERRAAAQGIDLSRLFVATERGRIRAAALLIPHPGRTGLLLASAPADERHAAVAAETCASLLRAAHGSGIRLAQALSSPGDALRNAVWSGSGMRHLATLDYMERPRNLPWQERALPEGIELAAWDPADRGCLERLLPRTYVETLDCPGLAQLRDPADILDGHLAVGSHDPRLWTIASHRGEPVAALLLSPSPESGAVEIVYLGIVPAMRGRGLGGALLSRGLALARGCAEPSVALAVDARNSPAVALYARAGFRTVRRREAFVAPLPA
jgi:ribosomal protein S18 acetylase RimI-like enzyme